MLASYYKNICQQPDVFNRFTIEQTLCLLPAGSPVKAKLQAILDQPPIPKPALHTSNRSDSGERDTDFLRVNVSAEEAQEIADALLTWEVEAVSPSGDTTPLASFYASMVDLWLNYADFQSSR